VGTGFAAEAPAELLDDDVSALALALALTLAGGLLAAFPLAADFAAWARGHGNSIMAGKIAKAVKHRTKLEHLGVMAGLSNAKLTGWSSTGGRGARDRPRRDPGRTALPEALTRQPHPRSLRWASRDGSRPAMPAGSPRDDFTVMVSESGRLSEPPPTITLTGPASISHPLPSLVVPSLASSQYSNYEMRTGMVTVFFSQATRETRMASSARLQTLTTREVRRSICAPHEA